MVGETGTNLSIVFFQLPTLSNAFVFGVIWLSLRPRKHPSELRRACFLGTALSTFAGVRGWGLITGLVLNEESPVLAGSVVAETTENGLLLVPAGLKVMPSFPCRVFRHAAFDQYDRVCSVSCGASCVLQLVVIRGKLVPFATASPRSYFP